MNLEIIIVLFYSYCLGSIPFGLIITKIFLNQDIRDVGSGNIGTTNVLRTGKKSLAINVILQSESKTLTESDLEQISNKIIETVKEKTGATIRS